MEEFLKIEAFLVLPGELVKQCQFVLMTNINNFKKYCLVIQCYLVILQGIFKCHPIEAYSCDQFEFLN